MGGGMEKPFCRRRVGDHQKNLDMPFYRGRFYYWILLMHTWYYMIPTKWFDYFCQNLLTRSSQSLLRPGEGWAQPFCRAFELHCHFVVTKKPFCRVGGLVLLQNESPRPHPGNWKGDVSINKHDSNWKNSGGSPSHDMFFAQTIEWCFMFNDEVIGKWCYSKWMDYSAVVFFLNLIIRKETLLDALNIAKFIRSE